MNRRAIPNAAAPVSRSQNVLSQQRRSNFWDLIQKSMGHFHGTESQTAKNTKKMMAKIKDVQPRLVRWNNILWPVNLYLKTQIPQLRNKPINSFIPIHSDHDWIMKMIDISHVKIIEMDEDGTVDPEKYVYVGQRNSEHRVAVPDSTSRIRVICCHRPCTPTSVFDDDDTLIIIVEPRKDGKFIFSSDRSIRSDEVDTSEQEVIINLNGPQSVKKVEGYVYVSQMEGDEMRERRFHVTRQCKTAHIVFHDGEDVTASCCGTRDDASAMIIALPRRAEMLWVGADRPIKSVDPAK